MRQTGQTGSGDQITMHALGFELEDNLEASQNYTWYGTPTQQQQNACYLEMCSFTVLDLLFNSAVTGSGPGISVCVTDSFGAEACDSMGLDIWGHYVEDYSFSSFDLSYSLEYDRVANIHFETSASPTGQIVGAQLGQNTGAFDSVVAFDMGFSNIFQTNEMGQETLEIAIPFENTFSYELWFKRTESQPWTQVNTDYVSTTAGNNGGTVMVYSHDGSQEVNLGSGTYAIFDAVAAFPPATGVTGLTADLRPGAQVVFNWVYGDNMLLWDTADTVTLYHCTGVDCTLDMNNPVFTLHPSTTSWTLIGTDATAYTVLVQTENGNVDPATGAKLTGGSASMNVVADGSVSPAPTITSTDASVGSDSLTFTWDATSTDDVNSWIICWAGTPDIVENDFSSLFGSSCAQTSDSTTSLTVLETTMCGAACNAELYFGIAAMDAPGNVGDSGGRMFVDMRGGIVDPGDDEVTEDDVGGLDDANGTTGNVDDDEGVNEESGETVATEGGFELKDAAVYGGILIAVIFVIVLAVILVPQLMSAAGDVAHATTMVGANVSSQHQQTTQVYQQPPQSAPVIHSNAPDPSINGEPNADGYEYLEWPQASAQWWYRLGVGLEWNVWQNQQNVVAQEPLAVPAEPVVEPVAVPAEPVVAAPQSPDASIGGEPNADGYEYLEWPQASAQWWYRITPGADWTKWEK